MSIKRKPMYYACCSICRTTHSDEQGPLLWDTRQAALDAALEEGWLMHRGRLYCPTHSSPTNNTFHQNKEKKQNEETPSNIMNNRIIHTCHCLNREFTVKEWQEFDHSPNKVVHTFNGYKYNINDVCLNPTKLDLSQGKYMLIISYCQSDCGRWSFGIEYLFGNSGGFYGCSFLTTQEEGHISREKAIYAALKDAKYKLDTEIDRIKKDYVYDDNGNKVQFGKSHIPHLRKLLSSVQEQLFAHRATQLTLF